MTTDSFAEFLAKQEFDRAETKRLGAAIAELQRDVVGIHETRHATQQKLAEVVGEIRVEHGTLEKQVSELVVSMQELVLVMKGSYGGQGLVSRVSSLEVAVSTMSKVRDDVCSAHIAEVDARIEKLETLVTEAQGMQRLIKWGAALIASAVAIKAFFVK